MAVVVTNQDGFNKFDKMKDLEGNYLLQPNPLNPTQKLLGGKPVHVFSNKTIKTVATKAPVIIGSLKEAITLFDREQMSLLSTNIGGTAFTKNRTDIRAITREDVQMVDSAALVYGEIVV
jgi:HK97 family phage major capsid protein